MFCLLSRDGRVLAVSDAHAGLPACDVVGSPIWNLAAEVDRDRFRRALMDALEFDRVETCTVRTAYDFDSWSVKIQPTLHVPDVKLVVRLKHVPEVVFELSPKQRHILQRMAAGLSVHAVAKDIGVTENTVRTQLKRSQAKTGCASLMTLVLMGREYLTQ